MMTKGTIFYIGAFELPDKNALAHRCLNNAKILRELGYRIVFLSISNSPENLPMYKKVICGFDCYIRPYPKSKKQWISYLTTIDDFKEAAQAYTDAKAVICYNYQAVSFYKIKKYCKKKGLKVIADCADWYNAKGNDFIFYMIKSLDSFLRMHVVQKKVDGMIVISSYLQNYYKHCKNVIVLPTLVDKSEKKWMYRKETRDDILHLAYAGSPGKSKDRLDVIVRAVIRTKANVMLHIAGITKEQFITAYPEFSEYDMKNIEFLGRLTHADSLRVVQDADFCIFLRDRNKMTMSGFPTKFAESTSAGIPVITTDTTDISKYLSDGINGFLISRNEMLDEIFCMNLKQLKEMKHNVDNMVFDFHNYVDSVDKWIENVLK